MSNLIEGLVKELEQFPDDNDRDAVLHLIESLRSSGVSLITLERTLSLLNAAYRDFLSEVGQKSPSVACSFCHRSREEVRQLVAATTVSICDSCNEIVARTIAEQGQKSKWQLFKRTH